MESYHRFNNPPCGMLGALSPSLPCEWGRSTTPSYAPLPFWAHSAASPVRSLSLAWCSILQ